MKAYLLVNFGGPRTLEEIPSFLTELLLDPDVVETKLPGFIHRWLFKRIARKRAKSIAIDYEKIGGRSPIFFDTEALGEKLRPNLDGPLLTFHRYLPATHLASLRAIEECKASEIHVVPLFPQYSHSTTGSIARFFHTHLSSTTERKLRWLPSYPDHPGFVRAFQNRIGNFLKGKNIPEEDLILLFSAHGLPLVFVERGDPYRKECERSFEAIRAAFPKALSRLSFQSKFGRGEWLRPYTNEVCEEIDSWKEGRSHVAVVPLSFTSDHIETLFEIEELYLSTLKEKGVSPHRVPALNLDPEWIEVVQQLFQTGGSRSSLELYRR